MRKTSNQFCKHCKLPQVKHETWSATGEYAEHAICPTDDVDEEGRYKSLNWFEPMDNLDYLEYKAREAGL